jgi:hypothetical protein
MTMERTPLIQRKPKPINETFLHQFFLFLDVINQLPRLLYDGIALDNELLVANTCSATVLMKSSVQKHP